jgi:hypothetical protein
VVKREGKRLFRRSGRRWEDNIKMELKENRIAGHEFDRSDLG